MKEINKMGIRKELKQIDIAEAINYAVDNLFPRFTKDKVLVVNIRMSAESFDEDVRINKEFYLLFYRPSNYTFVGLYEQNDPLPLKSNSKTKIKYLSYHDSCWMHDGTDHIINKMADELKKEITDKIKDINSIYIYNNFGIFGYKIHNAKIETNFNADNFEAWFISLEKEINSNN